MRPAHGEDQLHRTRTQDGDEGRLTVRVLLRRMQVSGRVDVRAMTQADAGELKL